MIPKCGQRRVQAAITTASRLSLQFCLHEVVVLRAHGWEALREYQEGQKLQNLKRCDAHAESEHVLVVV